MPRYDYDCAACGIRFEVAHGVTADPPTECPICGGGPIKKAFAPPTIHFKGSGWAKKERRSAVASGSAKTGGEDGTASSSSDGDAGKTGEAGKGQDPGKGDAGAKPADKPDKAPAPAATGPAAD